MKIVEYIDNIEKNIIEYRRHFHTYPELSMKEYKTQEKILEILKEHNIKAVKAADTGVIAFINEGKEGKCIALRADIDALPIQEKSDKTYCSKIPNVMHACGHDAHTAILLGTALTLNRFKEDLKGSVKLFFQPNEEVSSGARDIIKEGYMKNPQVDYILGLHVMSYLDVGQIEIKEGPLNASSNTVKITVLGKSSHGAYPHLGVDAIMISAHILTKLQNIVSRNIDPTDSAVVSIGKINGGVKTNIIADEVILEGTIRTTKSSTFQVITKRIKEIAENTAKAFNGEAIVKINSGYPPLINNPFLTNKIIETAKTFIKEEDIKIKEFPSMGAEDFGFYQDHAIGAFFHLGCGNQTLGINSSLHSNTFDIDEKCLKVGVKLQVLNTIHILNE